MRAPSKKPASCRVWAFTLLELLVLLGCLALALLVWSPAIARSSNPPTSWQCLNNLRQLGIAWLAYSEDNRGRLVYNPSGPGTTSWTTGWIDFTSNPDNTNTDKLVNHVRYTNSAFLGPYVISPRPFKCPADLSSVVMTGQRKARVRSVSMNSWMGEGSTKFDSSSPGQIYTNLHQFRVGKPANLFVFLEEHPQSINDGWLTIPTSPGTPVIIDFPASYHAGSCTFSFADGRAELHRWGDPRTMPSIDKIISFNVPSPGNVDLQWLRSHCTSTE